MKLKTNELTGATLDWAVCMAIGVKPENIYISNLGRSHVSLYTRLRDDDGELTGSYMTGPDLLFSRKWESGGPIIEREKIATSFCEAPNTLGGDCWIATYPAYPAREGAVWTEGPTPLIAAMRCFVANKLGDEIDVPEELV